MCLWLLLQVFEGEFAPGLQQSAGATQIWRSEINFNLRRFYSLSVKKFIIQLTAIDLHTEWVLISDIYYIAPYLLIYSGVVFVYIIALEFIVTTTYSLIIIVVTYGQDQV